MVKLPPNPIRSSLFSSFLLAAFLLSPLQALAVDTFNYVVPTSPYAGVTYQTNSPVTFNVQALSGASVDNGFNDVVTVGLYNTATSQLSDPTAVFVPSGHGPVIGATAPMTFQSGILNFGVTLTAGSNSMQVSIQDASITGSTATYPGTMGNVGGPGYNVEGYFQQYFLATSSGTSIPAFYSPLPTPGPTDLLLTSPVTNNANYTSVTVISDIGLTSAAAVSNSLCFAVTGVTGGYAGLNAGVSVDLQAYRSNLTSSAPVSFEVILDYNGTLTDYNTPDLSQDTVYSGSIPNLGSNSAAPSSFLTNLSTVTGISPPAFMTNGQVILRFWTGAASTNTVNLEWSDYEGQGFLSSIIVPYSNSNVQPVTAAMSPPVVLDSATNIPVTYTINNQYSSPISYLTIQIPTNNPSGSGTPFSVSLPGSLASLPGSSLGVLQATNSAPGAITLISGTTPIAVDQVIQIPLTITCSSQSNAWAFPLQTVLSNADISVPSVSGGAVITSEAPPPVPGSFTASAAAYITLGGGNVALNWGQVTLDGALGYVLTRSPVGGLFANSVTLPNGMVVANAVTLTPNSTLSYVDSTAANLTAYNYTLTAFNAVAQSTVPATAGPVTPYADPGPPSALQALTGGATIQLNWATPVAVPGSYPVTGYQIYRGTSPGGESSTPVAQVGLVTTYNDPGLIAGTTYYYYLSSMDNQYSGGATFGPHDSGPSAPVTGFPNGWPPTGLTPSLVSPSIPTIGLSWTAPDSTLLLNGPVTNYLIYKVLAPGVPIYYASVGSNATTFADSTGLAQGNSYSYQVAAIDSAGVTSNLSNLATQSVGPSAPLGLSAIPSASGVTLTWNANPGTQGVTQYVVYQNGVSITATAGVSFLVPSATAVQGQNDGYTLAAIGGGVTSPLSLAVSSALFPVGETGFTVAAAPTPNTTVNLSWAPLIAGNANAVSYNLYRNTTNSYPAGAVAVALGIPVTTAGNPVTSTQDLGLTPGTIYYYFLQAVNPYGVGSVTEQALQIPPNPPGTPTATSSTSAVNLSWTAIAGQNVSQYTIYRSQLPAGSPAVVGTATPGTASSFTDSGPLAQGVTYVYDLTATNPGGGPGIPGGESGPSGFVTWGLAPAASTGLAISGISTGNAITLAWNNVTATDPNATAVSLFVNANSAVTTGAVLTPISPVSSLSVTDSGVFNSSVTGESPDTTYNYWLQVTAPFGTSALEGPIAQLTYPAAVNLMPVTLGTDGVSRILEWNVLPADVTGYTVDQVNGGVTQTQAYPANAAGAPVTLALATQPGLTYTYYVTATNATGVGPISNGQTFSSLPSAPVSVTAVSGTSNTGVTVVLSWSDPVSASQGVTAYTVYKATALAGPYTAAVSGLTSFTYSDSTDSGSVSYFYILAADDNMGQESFLSTANAVAVTAFALPNPPGTPTAVPSNGAVSLNWTTGSQTTYSVSSYDISRVNAGVTTVIPTAGITYNDTAVVNGFTYVYFLQAVDSQGNLSPATASVTVTPLNTPGPPQNLGVGAGDQELLLTWKAGTPGTLPIGSYLIYRITSGPVTSAPISVTATSTSYLDTGLTDGTSYSYYMQSVDSTGVTTGLDISPPSALVSQTPVLGDVNPASNLAANAGAAQVILTWTDSVTVIGGADVTSYNVYRSTSPTFASPVTLAPVPVSGPTQAVTDTGLTNGTPYYYYVTAAALSNVSASSATVFGIPSIPPAAPTTLVVTPGNQQVLIDWPASAPVSGSLPISFYIVTINGAPVTVPATQTWYLDSGLTNPEAVTVSILAVDTTGLASGNHESTVVGPITVNTSASDLNPPTSLTASLSGTTAIKLTWVAPANEASYPVTAYNIYRAGNFITAVGSPLVTLANTTPVTSYVDSGLTPGTTYYYVIQAVYSSGPSGPGPLDSPNSNNATATAPAPTAGVPPVTVGVMAFDANILKPLTGQQLGIYFMAPNSGPVEIDIYNISGHPIRALYATAIADVAVNLAWDGKDRDGSWAASGVYLIEIKAPGLHQIKKVLVVK